MLNKIKNKKWWIILVAVLIIVGIGGKLHMDHKKELEELHIVQKDLANHIYQNFVIYTNDDKKLDEVERQYNENNRTWTTEEYIKKMIATRIYGDIEKIEFTNMYVTPMNTLEIQYKINDVYDGDFALDTKSAETNTWRYNITPYTGDGPYYLENKKQATTESIPDNKIIYYEGEINNGRK